MCILNFLPSVDDFWDFGNTILRDYYVYHNPEQGIMGWVPTNKKFKTALKSGPVPTEEIEFGYNWAVFWIKLTVAILMWAGTWATVQYAFTTSTGGLGFLNAASYLEGGSHKRSKQSNSKEALAKKIDELSTAQIESLLTSIYAKNI